jgi:general L-amino acid transport system substrate-binding protein
MQTVSGWWRVAVLVLALAAAAPAPAGEVLEGVKSRGTLRCGVSEGIAGFSERDASGQWRGLDADFCRAVAAAVLGDAGKVSFLPLKASARFPALEGRRIDLLVRNTTWTLTREAVLGLQFPAVLYYDGQSFLVRADSGITSPADLAGATVCVEKGTTHPRNMNEYFSHRGLSVTPLVIDSAREVADAFFAGRCRAYTSDASQLAAARLRAPGGPQTFTILPDRISKEPLAPVVWGGDPQWAMAVRWVLYALVLAEEYGATAGNVEALQASGRTPLARLTADERGVLARALGLPVGWAVRAIKASGHYGEMFERNLGQGSPLGIERGLNRLWTQGGMLYAPPID